MRETERAGWKMGEYAALIGFGRSKLYTLPLELQPKSVAVGARRVIIEPPTLYLERLRRMQNERVIA